MIGLVQKGRSTEGQSTTEPGILSMKKYHNVVGLHPLIHTFGSRKATTPCGGGSKRAKAE
jgi:hypothetical protein